MERLRKALMREDLMTVVVDLFPTDTTDFADFVLPAASFLEFDDIVASYFHLTLSAQVKAAEPMGEALLPAVQIEGELVERARVRIAELAANPALRLVECDNVQKLLDEQNLAASGRVDNQTAAKVGKLVFDTAVTPHWLSSGDRFWYSYETSQGRRWFLVDPAARGAGLGTTLLDRALAFDAAFSYQRDRGISSPVADGGPGTGTLGFYVKDIPPATPPDLSISRPGIYFGEEAADPDRTWLAVSLAALSTLLSFGLLAFSRTALGRLTRRLNGVLSRLVKSAAAKSRFSPLSIR